MAKDIIQENKITSFESINGKEDLKALLRSSVKSINGKEDLKARLGIDLGSGRTKGGCDCCGRLFEALTPFPKKGGEFDGALLVRRFRSWDDLTREEEVVGGIFLGNCSTDDDYTKARELLTKEFGAEEAERLVNVYPVAGGYNGYYNDYFSSWECLDCIGLDNREYWKKVYEVEVSTKKKPLTAIRPGEDES